MNLNSINKILKFFSLILIFLFLPHILRFNKTIFRLSSYHLYKCYLLIINLLALFAIINKLTFHFFKVNHFLRKQFFTHVIQQNTKPIKSERQPITNDANIAIKILNSFI